MKIALAQINPVVGDINANSSRILGIIRQAAKDNNADITIFSELALIGYPPKDLLLKDQFILDNISALNAIAKECTDTAALIGYVSFHDSPTGKKLHNSAALVYDGKVQATYIKQLLPTYDVFDEHRYFHPGPSQSIVEFKGQKLGLSICEDIWQTPDNSNRKLYAIDPFKKLTDENVDIIINMSASPFVVDKHEFRLELFGGQCKKYKTPMAYINQTGGNDELVFDGSSCFIDSNGNCIAQAKDFQEDLLLIDTDNLSSTRIHPVSNGIASVYKALVMGLGDYVHKCGFKSALIGLSGGIDSALTAAIAVDALGKDNVTGVAMPSRYSSEHSLLDAKALANNLDIEYLTIPIEESHAAMEKTLKPHFKGLPPGIAEENIQARLRGNILMALSNKFGHILLTTGNKSELAVGYCTMYGDMAGGLAVISDVPKMMVYEISRYINRDTEIIPVNTITKPPSAELRPDQLDADSLPDYEVLDEILHLYVEKEQSITDITKAEFDYQTVTRITRLVDRNEYKRKQAAPGLKVTSRAFGFGRRMPIAQNYQHNAGD